MLEQVSSLVDKCLIATPAIKDPIFASSLVYICQNDQHGSMGLVINHQASQSLREIFAQLNIDCEFNNVNEQPIYIGGPVQLEQGFILHGITETGDQDDTVVQQDIWQNTQQLAEGIYLTSSLDILQAIATNKGPKDYLVIMGFSGWESGQLESELHQNSWLTSACDSNLLFHHNADAKWQIAFDTLGFDMSNLAPVSGNA